jgi:hypothetical protein
VIVGIVGVAAEMRAQTFDARLRVAPRDEPVIVPALGHRRIRHG